LVYICKCARLNHSRRQHSYRAGDQAYKISMVTQKDFAKEEEITISYII
jgi:hypothetical protein